MKILRSLIKSLPSFAGDLRGTIKRDFNAVALRSSERRGMETYSKEIIFLPFFFSAFEGYAFVIRFHVPDISLSERLTALGLRFRTDDALSRK